MQHADREGREAVRVRVYWVGVTFVERRAMQPLPAMRGSGEGQAQGQD